MKITKRSFMCTFLLAVGLLSVGAGYWHYILQKHAKAFDESLSLNLFQVGMLNMEARVLNDPAAQYALGRYERFVNMDFSASMQWMQMAARNLHPDALYFLAAEKLRSDMSLSDIERIQATDMMRSAERYGSEAARQYLENERSK
jgi:TPR repeat protein